MDKWTDKRIFGLAALAAREYEENKKKVLRFVENKPGSRMLDVGCSNGVFTAEIAKKAGITDIYGMEVSPRYIDAATKKGIKVSNSDANNIFPFEDSFFGIIVSNQLLEHLHDTDGFFSEVYRTLEPGGYAVISTQNLASLHNLLLLSLGMQPISLHVSKIQVGNFLYNTETSGHIKIFTIPALKDLARHNGFTVEDTFGVGFYPFPNPLSNILSAVFRRYSVFIGIKIRKPKPA